jgi:hypothetical protein
MELRYARFSIGLAFLESEVCAQAESLSNRYGIQNVLQYICEKNYENTKLGHALMRRTSTG